MFIKKSGQPGIEAEALKEIIVLNSNAGLSADRAKDGKKVERNFRLLPVMEIQKRIVPSKTRPCA